MSGRIRDAQSLSVEQLGGKSGSDPWPEKIKEESNGNHEANSTAKYLTSKDIHQVSQDLCRNNGSVKKWR